MKYCVNVLREIAWLIKDVFGFTAFIPVIVCTICCVGLWFTFWRDQYWILLTHFSILLVIRIITFTSFYGGQHK